MVRIFSDFDDVRETRERADLEAARAENAINSDVPAYHVGLWINALRFEIRAAAQHISAAIGAALEQQGGR